MAEVERDAVKRGEGTKRCFARDASLAAGRWIGGPHERETGDLLMALVNWTAWLATSHSFVLAARLQSNARPGPELSSPPLPPTP